MTHLVSFFDGEFHAFAAVQLDAEQVVVFVEWADFERQSTEAVYKEVPGETTTLSVQAGRA